MADGILASIREFAGGAIADALALLVLSCVGDASPPWAAKD